MNVVNINQSNHSFLEEVFKYLNTDNQILLPKSFVLCTSNIVAGHLKNYFYQKSGSLPNITSIGNIDFLYILKIYKNCDIDVDLSNLTQKYPKINNGVIYDMDKDVFIYNFVLEECKNKDSIFSTNIYQKAKEIMSIIDMIFASDDFIPYLEHHNYNLSLAFEDFVLKAIKKLPEDLSSSAYMDFTLASKTVFALSDYLEANNLQTKVQKRILITQITCELLQNITSSEINIYFIGQNGENNLYNKICNAAKHLSTCHFICNYITQTPSKYYPFANKFCNDVINIKNIDDNLCTATKQLNINLVHTKNLFEQIYATTRFINNNQDTIGSKRIAIVTANQADANIVYNELTSNLGDRYKIFNTFGVNLTQTGIYKIYISLLQYCLNFNKAILFNIMLSINQSNNVPNKKLAITKEEVKTIDDELRTQSDSFFINHKSQIDQIKYLDDIIACFVQNIANIADFKSLVKESLKLLEDVLTQSEDWQKNELKMFLLTEICDIKVDIMDNFCKDFSSKGNPQNKIKHLIKVVDYLSSARFCKTNPHSIDSCNIIVASLVEMRYLSFDTTFVVNFDSINFGFKKQNKISNSIRKLFNINTTTDEFYKTLAIFKDVVSQSDKVFCLYSQSDDVLSGSSSPSQLCNYFECNKFVFKPLLQHNCSGDIPKDTLFVKKDFKNKVFSNTALELITKDRLEFFMQKVLGFRELNELERKPSPKNIGIVVHNLMAGMFQKYRHSDNKNIDIFAKDVCHSLELQYKDYFGKLNHLFYFWREVLKITSTNFFTDFIKNHARYEDEVSDIKFFSYIEKLDFDDFKVQIDVGGEIFILKSIPDRIDIFKNKLRIVDYKTGRIKTDGIQMQITDHIIKTLGNFYPQLQREFIFYELKNMDSTKCVHKKVIEDGFSDELKNFLLTYINEDFNFLD